MQISINNFIKKYGTFWMEGDLMEIVGCEGFNEDAWQKETGKDKSESSVRNLSFSTTLKNWSGSRYLFTLSSGLLFRAIRLIFSDSSVFSIIAARSPIGT